MLQGVPLVRNYVALFADADFLASLAHDRLDGGRSGRHDGAVAAAGGNLNRKFRGRHRALPLLLLGDRSPAVGLLWRWMSQVDFRCAQPLRRQYLVAHVRLEWLADPHIRRSLMVGIAIWASVPPTTLMLMAGCRASTRRFYEQADGAAIPCSGFHAAAGVGAAVSILLNVFVFNLRSRSSGR